MNLSVILKALNEEIRLRMIGLILMEELCVCDIEEVLEISQANASRHLTKLKTAGILSSRKNAQWVYYDISKKFKDTHGELLEAIAGEIKKMPDFKNDNKALAALKKRKSSDRCSAGKN